MTGSGAEGPDGPAEKVASKRASSSTSIHIGAKPNRNTKFPPAYGLVVLAAMNAPLGTASVTAVSNAT